MSDNGNWRAGAAGGVAVVERALTILAEFADRNDALTLAQIAQRSGLGNCKVM